MTTTTKEKNWWVAPLTAKCKSLVTQLKMAVKNLKEHNHIFAHAQDFDFLTGYREFKDARITTELS